MSETRAARVGQQIQREIATLMASGKLKDDRLDLVTVTAVKVTSDLQEGKVYFICHGGDERRAAAGAAFAELTGKLRGHIGRVMKLRHVPSLRFLYDESIERGARIEELLAEVRKKEGW